MISVAQEPSISEASYFEKGTSRVNSYWRSDIGRKPNMQIWIGRLHDQTLGFGVFYQIALDWLRRSKTKRQQRGPVLWRGNFEFGNVSD